MENLDVFKSDQLLDRWYMTCFAGVINESTLVRVWDKICGGSKKIVVFIFLEMAKALSDKAMKCKTSNEFKNLIEQVGVRGVDKFLSIPNELFPNGETFIQNGIGVVSL